MNWQPSTEILIVEDDYLVSEMIKELLHELGYRVIAEATNGLEAIEIVQQVNPDLILMDIKLPDIDGLEAARRIQACCPTPIIVLTAYETSDLLQAASEAGVGAYLTKPPNAGALNRAITIAKARFEDMMALHESEQKFRRVIEQSNDGIVLVDETGKIIEWNQGQEKITGLKWEDVVDRPIWDVQFSLEIDELKNPTTRAEFKAMILEFLETGDAPWVGESIEKEIQRPDGTRRTIQSITSAIKVEDGFMGTSITRDITERKRAEVEREQLIADLNAFAHTVAHDLKSPISGILGYAEILEEHCGKKLDEDAGLYLRRIIQSGTTMQNIIDELLLLSRLRNLEHITLIPLNMKRLIENVLERLDYSIEKKCVNIHVLDYETWPIALGYAPWIEEIWMNYIGNAIKYGGSVSEPPRVTIGAERHGKDMVRFWVRDNGPGLTPKQQACLFRPFTRLDDARTEGHGLGLSIVRRIVDKFGGQVGVESTVGEGSIFSFTLPSAEGR